MLRAAFSGQIDIWHPWSEMGASLLTRAIFTAVLCYVTSRDLKLHRDCTHNSSYCQKEGETIGAQGLQHAQDYCKRGPLCSGDYWLPREVPKHGCLGRDETWRFYKRRAQWLRKTSLDLPPMKWEEDKRLKPSGSFHHVWHSRNDVICYMWRSFSS